MRKGKRTVKRSRKVGGSNMDDDFNGLNNENIRHYVDEYINGTLTLEEKELLGGPIGNWDVSKVTDMSYLFSKYRHTEYNEDENFIRFVNELDKELFKKKEEFNETLNWDVSNVEDMDSMFSGCLNFNNGGQPLKWDVGKVKFMEHMFKDCKNFNQQLISKDETQKWNVSNVKDMSEMFINCENFNNGNGENPLNWDVVKVTNMEKMFYNCKKFNQTLNWKNVGKVQNMELMFRNCEIFNNGNGENPLKWNVGRVISMRTMFAGCKKFNQTLDWENVESVERMPYMFSDCIEFNNGGKPLIWNVEKVKSMERMFENCKNLKVPITFYNLNDECNIENITKGIPHENNLVINENKLLINPQKTEWYNKYNPFKREATTAPTIRTVIDLSTTPPKNWYDKLIRRTGGRITRKQKGKKVHQKKSRKMPIFYTF